MPISDGWEEARLPLTRGRLCLIYIQKDMRPEDFAAIREYLDLWEEGWGKCLSEKAAKADLERVLPSVHA